MAVSLVHAFTSAKSDGGDSSLVRPSNWNAEHTLTLSGPNKALGRLASGSGAAVEVTIRETLDAARTYYVRTDGSDSNTGLANTAGGAKLTVQGALDAIAQIDFNGYAVTVQIADGTYTGNVTVPVTVGQLTVDDLIIRGNAATPTNVVIDGGFVTCTIGAGARCQLRDFKFTSSGWGVLIASGGAAEITGVDFGACDSAQMRIISGGTVRTVGDYTISGGSDYHVRGSSNGTFFASDNTVTISGTPAFGDAFADASTGAVMEFDGVTFSGSATGVRYSVTLNGVINTNGGGATYLPGNSAGSTATGGQYA